MNRASEDKPPGGLLREFALEYKVKQSTNSKFPSHYKLARSILKRKFPLFISPSEYRPLQTKAPQKGPLKNISPGAFFLNFTVFFFNGDGT